MTEQIVKIQLPRPHFGQQEVLDSNARFKVLMCGRRWGKSLICQIIAIQNMLVAKHVAYITPTHELGRVFYADIMKLIPPELIANDNKTDRKIELVTGGSIKFLSGEVLDAFRGLKFHKVIVDEAAYIPDLQSAWNTAIRPTLIDYRGDAIFISTPSGKEYFYSLHEKGMDPTQPDWQSFHFTTFQNPTLPPGEAEAMKAELTQAQINQELLAIAGENSANPIGTDNIRNNTLVELSNEPTVVYGVDLAKYNDYTVITGLDRFGHMTYFDRFQLPWPLTQNRIEQLPGNILKVVDSSGLGDVVFDSLQLTCQNIIGFKFTTESKPKLIYEMIKDIEKGNLKFNEHTANEMYVYEYTYSSTGHIKFSAKAGFHDDCIAALALANKYKSQALSTATWKLY